MSSPTEKPRWGSLFGLVLCGFLAVGGFFLVTEHAAHLYGALPWFLLAGCLLMHHFMHRKHGGREGGGPHDHRGEQ